MCQQGPGKIDITQYVNFVLWKVLAFLLISLSSFTSVLIHTISKRQMNIFIYNFCLISLFTFYKNKSEKNLCILKLTRMVEKKKKINRENVQYSNPIFSVQLTPIGLLSLHSSRL